MQGKACVLCKVAMLLMAIGGLNWGLVGIGGFAGSNLNVVNLLLGSWPTVEWIVYILVGVATVVSLVGAKKCSCRHDSGMMGEE